jgi:hypothetical protein
VSGLFLRRSVVVVLLPHPDSRVIPLANRTSPVRLRSPYGLPPTHPNLSPMKRPRVAGLNSNRVARLSDAAIQCRISTAIHNPHVSPEYLALALNSPHCYALSQRYTHGSTNKDLGLTRMVLITVPFPPLVEQRRIVARVEELRLLCATLRERLTARQTCQARFAEALVEQGTWTAPLVEKTDDLAAAA